MKVVTFGELMVRLQPFNYERFVQANSLEFCPLMPSVRPL